MMLYVTYGPIDLETRQGPKGTTLDLGKDALKRFWENAQKHAQNLRGRRGVGTCALMATCMWMSSLCGAALRIHPLGVGVYAHYDAVGWIFRCASDLYQGTGGVGNRPWTLAKIGRMRRNTLKRICGPRLVFTYFPVVYPTVMCLGM